MRRYSFNARRTMIALAATLVASLGLATAAAQARVLNDGGTTAGVSLVPGARGNALPGGVSAVGGSGSCMDPWLASDLGGPVLPSGALCYQGGPVMHKNETFALTWDNTRANWAVTRGYVEQFLRDVADASGSLSSPFAVTTQYNDAGGKAQNASVFGGGCIDFGVTGGSSCEYGTQSQAGHDYPASSPCTATGDSFVAPGAVIANDVCLTDTQLRDEVSTMVNQTGTLGRTQPGYTPLVALLLPADVETCLDGANTLCSANGNLTPPPPDVTTSATGGTIPSGTYRVEVTYVMSGGESVPSGSQTITTTGGTSTISIASPPSPPANVVTGLGTVQGWYAYVTQANGSVFNRQHPQGVPGSNTIGTGISLTNPMDGSGPNPPAITAFCSYHSQVNVGGTNVAYVVQPWTAGTACDEPDAPTIPQGADPQTLSVDIGARLVSPLSQSEIAAIVNPGLNGWTSNAWGSHTAGWEIDDNGGCVPYTNGLDKVTIGSSSQNPYVLQREFNNAGALEFDPFTYFGCAPVVNLNPSFVVPSSVDEGDVVQLDGSTTASTLIVPNRGYAWDFGDGSGATGPSVVHSYAKGGNYNVKLTVTDRGGNVATVTQEIQVLGDDGQTVLPPPTTASPTGPGSGSGSAGGSALNARLLLMPQSLKRVLRSGISVRVTSNKAANGIASVAITRAEAKRAHIKIGKGPTVRIGLGTVASIKNGTVTLHLHLSRTVAKKLSHLKHLTLTVRLALVAAGNQQLAIDVAGRY